MKVVVLGGCGAQGLFAVKEFIAGDVFSEVVIADIDLEKADEIAKQLNSPKISTRRVDVLNHSELLEVIDDADLVANCTGPYYLLGERVIKSVLEAGKNYIDYCDDVIVHENVFTEENQELAKEKGITLLIGLGASPGLVPLLVMGAAQKFDKVEDVQIMELINDREPEGEAVILHLIENFDGKVPIIKNGELVEEEAFEGEEVRNFKPYLGEGKVSTFGHPEIFSLPRVLPHIKNLSVKLGTFPVENYEVLKLLAQLGLASKEPMMIKSQEVVPRDILITLLMGMPPRTELVGSEPETVYSSVVIELGGEIEGKEYKYESNINCQMGPGTGVPLVIGAEMLVQGKIKQKGLVVPEECIEPVSFIAEWEQRMKKDNYPYDIQEKMTAIEK